MTDVIVSGETRLLQSDFKGAATSTVAANDGNKRAVIKVSLTLESAGQTNCSRATLR